MTPKEKRDKAWRRYTRKVDKSQYPNDLIDAALEYIGVMERIIEKNIS